MSEAGFGINTNLLETNLINIVLLLGLLISSFGDQVKTSLKARQDRISDTLDNAANRLIFANDRYKESLKALEQVRISSLEIQQEKINDFKEMRNFHFSRFQPYLVDQAKALKSLVVGQCKSFDRQFMNQICSFYEKHEEKVRSKEISIW